MYIVSRNTHVFVSAAVDDTLFELVVRRAKAFHDVLVFLPKDLRLASPLTVLTHIAAVRAGKVRPSRVSLLTSCTPPDPTPSQMPHSSLSSLPFAPAPLAATAAFPASPANARAPNAPVSSSLRPQGPPTHTHTPSQSAPPKTESSSPLCVYRNCGDVLRKYEECKGCWLPEAGQDEEEEVEEEEEQDEEEEEEEERGEKEERKGGRAAQPPSSGANSRPGGGNRSVWIHFSLWLNPRAEFKRVVMWHLARRHDICFFAGRGETIQGHPLADFL